VYPKREKIAGDWRRLHNEELHNLYTSPNVIRTIKSMKMRLTGHIAGMGEMRNAYKILVGKLTHRWEDNIKINLKQIGCEDLD